jgi:hypothetical protein
MNASEKVPHESHDLVEVRFQRPVPALKQVQFCVRQIPEIGSRRALGHVVVLSPPDDQCWRPVLAQIGLVFGKPIEILPQTLHQTDHDFATLWLLMKLPRQFPEIGTD